MASLSRTHRPRTFAEILGQEPVKETLRKEVATGILGHAYLFAGPRGIGKTTMARVFAKALNCLDRRDGEPCNECDACREQNDGRALDIIEMDAASNTGVDNIREAIIEHVRFVPHSRKFKVYILDEAHMLSTSAWNALLKTLEEPPPYALFILVTTELHKVPATILSRCQRFDFKRITAEVLAERLGNLAKKEGVELAPEVAVTIVAKADGSIRDAESLLGQLIALGEKNITAEVASLVLPESRLPLAAAVLENWSERKLGTALKIVADLEEQGIPLLPLFDDLLQAIRFLLIAKDSAEFRSRLEKGDEGEKKLLTIVGNYQPEELADIALMLMERRRDAKQGADVRFCLELAAAAVAMSVLPHGPKKKQEAGSKKLEVRDEKQEAGSKKLEAVSGEPTEKSEAPDKPQLPTTNYSLQTVLAKWPAIISAVDAKSKSLTFILKLAKPIKVQDKELTLSFQYPFHKEKIIGDAKTRQLVETCLGDVLQVKSIRLEGVIGEATNSETTDKPRNLIANVLKAFEGQVVEEGNNAS